MFLRSLEDVVAEERGKACLQCEVSKQAVTPVWRKDSMVINASEKYEIHQLGRSLSLIIHKLRKDDAAEYSCDVGSSQTKAKVVVRGKSNLNSECVFWINQATDVTFPVIQIDFLFFFPFFEICTSPLSSA